MFVNGERRHRPSLPKQGLFRVAGLAGGPRDFQKSYPGMPAIEKGSGWHQFEYKAGDIDPKWRNPDDMMLVCEHFWFDEHIPIRAIDGAKRVVTLQRKSQIRFTESHNPNVMAQYRVENVYEALTEPGEWYLDRRSGVLTYLPKPGEDPATVLAVLPIFETPVLIKGDPQGGRSVSHLVFEGLTFSDNTWRVPNDTGNVTDPKLFAEQFEHLLPYGWKDEIPGQSTACAPGAVSVAWASHLVFDSCRFMHCESYGLDLGKAVFDCRVSFCEFRNNGAGGLKIGGAIAKSPTTEWNGRHQITDNHVHHLGEIYPSAAGILSLHSFGNVIAHNDVHHLAHNGISVGWLWRFNIEHVSRDNLIEGNYVHDIRGGEIDDMGGIYLVGIQPGTFVRSNYVRDIGGRPTGAYHGIYLDRAGSAIVTVNNLVVRVQSLCYKRNQACNNIVRNNIFVSGGQMFNTSIPSVDGIPTALSVERNICVLLDAPPRRAALFNQGVQSVLEGNFPALKFNRNCYWNLAGTDLPISLGATVSWRDWQAAGMDVQSLVADPLFVDPKNDNFSLRPESPAITQLGFKPLDLSKVGPRTRSAATPIIPSQPNRKPRP